MQGCLYFIGWVIVGLWFAFTTWVQLIDDGHNVGGMTFMFWWMVVWIGAPLIYVRANKERWERKEEEEERRWELLKQNMAEDATRNEERNRRRRERYAERTRRRQQAQPPNVSDEER